MNHHWKPDVFNQGGVEPPKPPPLLCKHLCIRACTSITVKNQVEKMYEGAEPYMFQLPI